MTIEISVEDSKYMYNVIKYILEKYGPRMPCSSAEAHTAEFFKEELEKSCDKVIIEPFKCHPRAFLGWIKINVSLVLISLLSYLLLPFIGQNLEIQILIITFAVILNITAFLIIWNEFFNYREFIDKVFKERASQNVVGRFEAKEELEKILIFSGHHDSALQFNLLRYLNVGYVIIIFLGLSIMFIWIILSVIILILIIINLGYILFYNFIFILFILGLPAFIGLFFFVSSGEKANKVPGANDNLSAVAVLLGLGKYLQSNKNIINENTEIRIISFGCEEAGLRGAYRYVASHFEELKRYNVEVINMDIIQSNNNNYIFDYEPTTRTKHSLEVIQKIKKAADLADINIKVFGSSFTEKLIGQIMGGTDAAAFSKSNIKAATIQSMDFSKFLSFYHQPTDNLDMVSERALINALKICISYILNEYKK
jgi:hypothetical protein